LLKQSVNDVDIVAELVLEAIASRIGERKVNTLSHGAAILRTGVNSRQPRQSVFHKWQQCLHWSTVELHAFCMLEFTMNTKSSYSSDGKNSGPVRAAPP
jgi:hypothetical protein